MPLATEQPVDIEDWDRIEDAFRLHAFNVYYRRTFAEERDSLKRFVKALVASAQPIRDRQAVLAWYRQRRARDGRRRQSGSKGETR